MPPPASASILAFHGGGFLGYFSARIAQALQERRESLGVPGPLRRSFDMISGTSVGAILAAAVATDTPPERVVGLMKENGPRIFPKRGYLATLPGIFAARFRQGPLRELLDDILGSVRLGDLDRPLVIPAVNESRGAPLVFRSADPAQHELRLADVVLASAAAPTYLPLHRIDGERYADGGLVANSPALLASADLTRQFGIRPAGQRVISVGTTRVSAESPIPSGASDRWGGLRWMFGGGSRLKTLVMTGQEALQGELLAGLGPAGRLHLDLELSPDKAERVDMVLADSDAQRTLEAAARDCVGRVSAEDRAFLDRCLLRASRSLGWETGLGGNPRPVLVRD